MALKVIADVDAPDVKLCEKGVAFKVSYENKEYDVELGIPGMFSVYNALTALGCLVSAGIHMDGSG